MTMSANLRALSGYGLYMLQYVRDAICLLMMWAGRDVVATTLTRTDDCTVLAGQAPSHLLHVVYILMRACPLGRPWPLLFRRSSFIRVGVWLSCRGRFPFSWLFVVASFRAFPSFPVARVLFHFPCLQPATQSIGKLYSTPLRTVSGCTGNRRSPAPRAALLVVRRYVLTYCYRMFADVCSAS